MHSFIGLHMKGSVFFLLKVQKKRLDAKSSFSLRGACSSNALFLHPRLCKKRRSPRTLKMQLVYGHILADDNFEAKDAVSSATIVGKISQLSLPSFRRVLLCALEKGPLCVPACQAAMPIQALFARPRLPVHRTETSWAQPFPRKLPHLPNPHFHTLRFAFSLPFAVLFHSFLYDCTFYSF